MSEQTEKKTLGKRILDGGGFVLLLLLAAFLAWLCSRASTTRSPEEMDCLQELRDRTHNDGNYTEEDVVSYGRCLLREKGEY